jgi:glycine cleavage system H lipoate-binding protein/ferredoxin
MPKLTIDGKPVEMEAGKTVLEAAQKIGVHIPTLCYHKEVTAYGACRLCIVEVSRGNKTRLVVSCLYSAEDSLVVDTKSARVMKNRRMIIELLLARCPDSQALQGLAKEYGVGEPRFSKKNESCILCGLCVRVCNEVVGANAIGFGLRGVLRKISTPFEKPPETCLGCGACTYVCPTNTIQMESAAREQWADKLAAGGRECRYSRMGLVSHKICPRAFECHRCEVDQLMETALNTHPALATRPAAQRAPMQISEFSVVPGLRYSTAHVWTRLVEDTAKVGIDDFAAAFLGEAHAVDVPEAGRTVRRGEILAEIHVGRRSVHLPAPIGGKIIDMNPLVAAVPGLVTSDPYGQGWLFTMEAAKHSSDAGSLLGTEEASALVQRHANMLHQRATQGLGVTITDGGGKLVRNLHEVLSDTDWQALSREFFSA